MNVPRQAGRSCLLALAGTLLLLCGIVARAADEEALEELWKQHLATPDDHEAIFKACREFVEGHADDPLLPVVRGLDTWHRLRANQKDQALKQINADLTAPAGQVNEGARRIALGWMTRADRDQLAAVLQAYYRKQVAYPKGLDQLPADAKPLLNDRFGKPWTYKLTGFAKVSGFADQKYALQSAALGDTSEFKVAVQLPYASRITATPAQIVAGPANLPAVKFNFGARPGIVALGQSAGDLYLAFVGTRILVVCDYTHWKIFPKP